MQIPQRSGFVQIAEYTDGIRKIVAWEDPENGKSKQELAALILSFFARKTAEYGQNVKKIRVNCETPTKFK